MERITKNKLVAFHFTLTDEEGNQLDTTRGMLPMLYVHGHNHLPSGIEAALAGKCIGDQVEAIIPPEQGFGLRDEELLQQVPKSIFEGQQEPEIGMEIQAETADGPVPVRVVAIGDTHITVDGNHAFAGKQLHLNAEIRNVRNATADELRSELVQLG